MAWDAWTELPDGEAINDALIRRAVETMVAINERQGAIGKTETTWVLPSGSKKARPDYADFHGAPITRLADLKKVVPGSPGVLGSNWDFIRWGIEDLFQDFTFPDTGLDKRFVWPGIDDPGNEYWYPYDDKEIEQVWTLLGYPLEPVDTNPYELNRGWLAPYDIGGQTPHEARAWLEQFSLMLQYLRYYRDPVSVGTITAQRVITGPHTAGTLESAVAAAWAAAKAGLPGTTINDYAIRMQLSASKSGPTYSATIIYRDNCQFSVTTPTGDGEIKGVTFDFDTGIRQTATVDSAYSHEVWFGESGGTQLALFTLPADNGVYSNRRYEKDYAQGIGLTFQFYVNPDIGTTHMWDSSVLETSLPYNSIDFTHAYSDLPVGSPDHLRFVFDLESALTYG